MATFEELKIESDELVINSIGFSVTMANIYEGTKLY